MMRTPALAAAALLLASTAVAAGAKDPAKTAVAPAPVPAGLVTGSNQPAAFSVEMHMKDEKGKDFVITRIVDGGKNRMEMAADGHKMTMISLDDEAKTTYMVDDEHKMVMKMSAAKQMEEAKKHQKKSDEVQPAPEQPQGQIEALGQETVNGRLANKYKASYGDQGSGLMWMDAENNLPIRMESEGKGIDFKNYDFSPQPAEKFAPPKDYEVRDMDEMMSKMTRHGRNGRHGQGHGGRNAGRHGGGHGWIVGGRDWRGAWRTHRIDGRPVRWEQDRPKARQQGRQRGDRQLSGQHAQHDSPEERKRLVERILASPTYKLAFEDLEFLREDDLRPVRLQLELLKPERQLYRHHIKTTVVVFGSARVPSPEAAAPELAELERRAKTEEMTEGLESALQKARKRVLYSVYYDEARKFGRLISERFQEEHKRHFVVITGGGPGIMEAANRGAHDVGCRSVGLNIEIPHEQEPNPYITPELCFFFHYFALRKMHFMMRARALVAFPGGFGTLDELTDALTLIQTKKIEPMPIILIGEEYWKRVLDFDFLVEEGMIAEHDAKLVTFLDRAEDAVQYIEEFYSAEKLS